MRILRFLRAFVIIFIIVFFVSLIVSYLYNLVAHGAGTLEWETAIRFALILGVVIPLSGYLNK